MTVHSMTGFAHASAEYAGKNIDIEIRSVNHRFLDVQFKLPDDLRCLESNMREKIVSKVARGKLECRIQLGSAHQQQSSLHINQPLVQQLADINQKLRKKHSDLGKLTVADILRFPGVLTAAETDKEELARVVGQLLEQVLDDFVAARRRAWM